MKRSSPERLGFTLVEVLIALSLLGITMATVVALFSSGMQLRAVTREHLAFQHAEAPTITGDAQEPEAEKPMIPQTYTRDQPKVGRNEPCPCGSGKKYKQCHGKL